VKGSEVKRRKKEGKRARGSGCKVERRLETGWNVLVCLFASQPASQPARVALFYLSFSTKLSACKLKLVPISLRALADI